jgi:ABC-type Zn uptake system ZnuABC Zn-binding protein ZnuA
MSNRKLLCLLAFLTVPNVFVTGCRDKPAEGPPVEIAVTNSYLGCAVRELCGDDTQVLSLAPPGMCPGHFDISPSQVRRLCDCRVLLLFDFQKQLVKTLSRVKQRGLKTALVAETGGLCVPETYLSVCRQVSDILAAEHPEMKGRYQQRLRQIEKNLKSLSQELLEKVHQAGISSAKVLTSHHQADFLDWLGLETIETFVGGDIETIAGVERCISKARGQDVRFVVANKQEGTEMAKALAERLGAQAVVFSNFPELVGQKSGFHQLLRANVDALLEANAGDFIRVAGK